MNLENTWTYSDIVQLVASLILFMLGIWIGKNQEKSVNLTKNLTEEIKFLQTGLSELEIYEKIGVIEKGLNQVSQGEASAAPTLLYDCLALLPILQFCNRNLADKYVNLLLKSLDLLTEYYSFDREPMPSILIDYSLKQIEIIENINSKESLELATEMKNALARYLDRLKSTNQQKMKEVCAPVLTEESVKRLLSVESGDTYKIMNLLKRSNQKKINY